jgi:hypothetical protein
MTGHGTARLSVEVALLVMGPPVMAIIFGIMSRGWILPVLANTTTERTKAHRKNEFWVAVIVLYVATIGMVLYGWLAN